jgi:hypothetical protein
MLRNCREERPNQKDEVRYGLLASIRLPRMMCLQSTRHAFFCLPAEAIKDKDVTIARLNDELKQAMATAAEATLSTGALRGQLCVRLVPNASLCLPCLSKNKPTAHMQHLWKVSHVYQIGDVQACLTAPAMEPCVYMLGMPFLST